MTAIAWAIIFLAACLSDAAYIFKVGTNYDGNTIIGVIAITSFTLTMICTVREWFR